MLQLFNSNKKLVISAVGLGVGLLYAGIKYKTQIKPQKLLEVIKPVVRDDYFIIDRLIDVDCNAKTLSVGISKHGQGIRWGQDDRIRHLKSFCLLNQSGLQYNFEDDWCLIINKNLDGRLVYCFQTGTDIIKRAEIDTLLTTWKSISMNSVELDKISELK